MAVELEQMDWAAQDDRFARTGGRGGASRPETIYDKSGRPPAAMRKMANWPLPEIAWTRTLVDSDFDTGSEFPPKRCRPLQRRLDMYARLARGDFSDFINDKASRQVMANLFSRLPNVLAFLMCQTLDTERQDIIDAALTTIIHQERYGRSFPLAVDGMLTTMDSRWCYDHEDGDLVIIRPISTTDNQVESYNALEFSKIPMAGAGMTGLRWTQKAQWTSGRVRLGTMLSEEEMVDAEFEQVDRPPLNDDGWGTSAFDDIIPLVVPLSARLSGIDGALTVHELPTLIVPATPAEVQETFLGKVANIDQFGKGNVPDALQRIPDADVVWAPNAGVQQAEYLEKMAGLDDSFGMTAELRQLLRLMTGLVSMLDEENADRESGVALREKLGPLYWTAHQMWVRNDAALSELAPGEYDWPDPFGGEDEDEPDGPEEAIEVSPVAAPAEGMG